MNTLKLYLSSLLIFFTTGMIAQENFSEWDHDGDYLIEQEEFQKEFTEKFYSVWSEDAAPEGIVEEGFFKESYAGLDTDGDGYLSDEEWLVGYNYFYEDYLVHEDIGYIDTDGDGFIDYDEYYDVTYNTEYFTDVDLDSDNYISEYELADFAFDNWDFDDNGVLSKYEWNSFKSYYYDI